MKYCYSCHDTLPKTSFYKDKKQSDHLQCKCKKCCKIQDTKYRKTEKRKEYMKKYHLEHKSNYQKIYIRNKRRNDIQYNLTNRTRSLLHIYLKKRCRDCRASLSYLNYTMNELKTHLENNFTDGMTWDKFLKGEIEIDHIKPISKFNYSSIHDKEFKECWSLSNLQPLWKKENRIKYNK